MRISKVEYSRVFSLGNYENEKIGVEVEVLEGENPQDAFNEAKKFVDLSSKCFNQKLEKARQILKNPDVHYGRDVKEAEEFLKEYQAVTSAALPAADNGQAID